MKENFDNRIKEWFPLKNNNFIVNLENDEGIDDYNKAKSMNTMPSHFGSNILSHTKRIMNDVIKQTDGFYNNNIYYTDTDSLHIHKNTGLTELKMVSLEKLSVWVKMITVIRVYSMLGF